ncbi:MAG: glycoside hydrolase family 3 C-terminal domain-containing protein [Bacteroidales bacterium]|nr:glycoside hydrolase family 3 C-terminal domain-containing protein [Bacteroidales bacterium]
MKKLFVSIITFALAACTMAQQDFRNPNLPIEERAQLLLNQLTLDEKLGMMEHRNPAVERLGIPAYSWWNEALHGVARNGFATVYPMPTALAATFDDKLVQEMFGMIADEARMKYYRSQQAGQYDDYTGLTFFTPNINIFRDPRWGRGMETYGEDPYLTARMGTACVNGLQQQVNGRYKALACIKHFAVHSGPEADRHSFDATVSGRALWTTYLPAFKYIVKHTDVGMVMCGYNRLNNVPCCTNESLLVDILQNLWGYDRIFVTDCWALNDCWERDTVIPRHETHATAADAAAAAFGSVVDLECGSGLPALKEAVEQGLIPEYIIDAHVLKILKARIALGMFDPEQPFKEIPDTTLFEKKALEMAQKSIVLLQNKEKILPLQPGKYKRIAIFGPNAADSAMLCGNYNGTPRHAVTIYEGITNYINTLPANQRPEIYFDTVCHHVDGKYLIPNDFDKQIAKCDLVIFVGGLSPELEGEELKVEMDGFHGGDRTNIDLPRIQEGMLMKIKKMGKPIVFVLCSGGAVALDWEDENLDAILAAWYGGQAAGTAVADVLFGKVNPSGKLPVTFYSTKNYIPPFDSYEMEHRTYRFMTEEPLYPFGYGLSYTNFKYSDFSFDAGQQVFYCRITNTGNRDGEEVAQLYMTNKNDPRSPVKTLVGFERVNIPAGATRVITFTVDPEFFHTFVDEYQHFEKHSNQYLFRCGDQELEINL